MVKRVGVLRGGAGERYAFSLEKGGDIISHILENLSDRYKLVDILVDKNHIWHFGGVPVVPGDLVQRVDVVWNVSHPSLSNILESLSIPYVGSSPFSSALERNREMLREHAGKIGLNVTRRIVIPVYQKDFDGPRERYAIKKAKEVFEKFGAPWIIRSFGENAGTMGVHVAETFGQLVSAIEDGVGRGQSILVEEFITGKPASLHSVAGFRGEDIYTFPFFNPFSSFSQDEKEKLITVAKNLHKHLATRHYLESQFVLHPRGRIYLAHLESTPDLKPDSDFSRACESAGAKAHQVVEHILESALR